MMTGELASGRRLGKARNKALGPSAENSGAHKTGPMCLGLDAGRILGAVEALVNIAC
jgi:hypothetical protein